MKRSAFHPKAIVFRHCFHTPRAMLNFASFGPLKTFMPVGKLRTTRGAEASDPRSSRIRRKSMHPIQ